MTGLTTNERQNFIYLDGNIYMVLGQSKTGNYIRGQILDIERVEQLSENSKRVYFDANLQKLTVDLTLIRLHYIKYLNCIRLTTLKDVFVLVENGKSTLMTKYDLLPATVAECPVCYESKETFIGFYKCKHCLCRHCFNQWTDKNKCCPLCRSE